MPGDWSTAAFHSRSGGSMFAKTGSLGSGMGQSVLEVRHIVELSCIISDCTVIVVHIVSY